MKHFEKVNFLNLDHFGKTLWKKWWTASADLKGQEHWLQGDLMSSLWRAAWKKLTSETIDNDMSVCCAIYPAASTTKDCLFSSSSACLNWVIKLVPLRPGSGTFWLRCCTEHNEMCMEHTCCTPYFPCVFRQEHVQAEALCPLEVLYLNIESNSAWEVA